ncbi:hypothetical protein TNCV_4658701 [Trichonephila clavipes]|nr:hypothetical protein TNCV_4658701 [Trichonephila clavipes]
MKHSPFSYASTLNLPSSDVEPHSLSFTQAGLEFDEIYFHDQRLSIVTKSSEIPALVNQLALKTINGIPQSSLKIYTDGSREGNERADVLARTASVEDVSPRGNPTFSEISTYSKLELNRQIKIPPSHAWYFAKCPDRSSQNPCAVRWSFEHKTCDNMIWLGSPTNVMEENLGGGQEPPSSCNLKSTLLEDLQLGGYLEPPMQQRHYTITNIYAFRGFRIQVPRKHSSPFSQTTKPDVRHNYYQFVVTGHLNVIEDKILKSVYGSKF